MCSVRPVFAARLLLALFLALPCGISFVLGGAYLYDLSERPKGGFSLTAETVLRPQGPSLIAAVIETFGRKRIAAERGYFGRKKLFWLAVRSLFRPKQALRSVTVRLPQFWPQPKESYGRKMRP